MAHLRPKQPLSCKEIFGTDTLPAEGDTAAALNTHALQIGFGEERPLEPAVFSALLARGKAALDAEPNVLELSGKVAVIGPVRGQYYDLLHILTNLCSAATATASTDAAQDGDAASLPPVVAAPTAEAPFTNALTGKIELQDGLKLLFLGDMVDGGHQSSQVLLLLLALKLKHPEQVFLLRGRRESRSDWPAAGRSVLLRTELAKRYGTVPGAEPAELYTECWSVFKSLPIAAAVNAQYFCVAGGIGPFMSSTDELETLVRQDDPLKESTLCDAVWSDPMDDEDEDLQASALFLHNYEKGLAYSFSFNAVMQFLEAKGYYSIVRGVAFPDSREVPAHVTRASHNSSGRPWHYQYSCYDPGYRLFRRSPTTHFPGVISLFSAPHFLNENENRGAVMFIDGQKMHIRQFTASHRPYCLPKMCNALEWSLPLVCSQAASIAEEGLPHDTNRGRLLGFQKLCKLMKKKERAQGNDMTLNGLSGLVKDEHAAPPPQTKSPTRLPVFYSLNRFERLRPLQEHWQAIRDECAAVWSDKKILDLHRPHGAWVGGNAAEFMESYRSSEGWIPSYQSTTGRNYSWLNYGLMHNGQTIPMNAERCPKTAELVQQINKIAQVRVCGFSAMLPKTEIKPHKDQAGVVDNALAFHLGLMVPSKQDCYLLVDNQIARHEDGEVIIFDATYTHSATNDSDEVRIVLYIDFQLCSTDPIQKFM